MSNNAVAAFINQLRQAQILDESRLAEVDRLGRTANRPADVAGELVKRGWLTPYQANQVARGRGGELVLGSYIVLEPLGAGGMGQVVKARHRVMHRQVAVKFIRHDQRTSADLVQRFQREVRLLAELRHSHIVHAYDAGNIGDTWFLAMELLDGIDLDRLLHQNGPLPVGQACAYIRQAALGLQYAHERGLVHRDIKPSNLFLTSEGIKLLDLGLARPQAVNGEQAGRELTRANTVMGTPDYLAPEQALDPRHADARSDLYSLGCTLYALLAGRPPFAEGTLTQKLLAHQTSEPPAIQTACRGVPPALATLIGRLLAKAPAQRPASAAVVAAELAPFVAPVAVVVPTQVPGSQPAPITQEAGASGLSLVSGRAAAPERGFTLAIEPVPPVAPVNDPSALATPSWLVPVDSVAPAHAASPTAMPARGVFPATETVLPAPAATGVAWAPATEAILAAPAPLLTAAAEARSAPVTAAATAAPSALAVPQHSSTLVIATPASGGFWSRMALWQRGAIVAGFLLLLAVPALIIGMAGRTSPRHEPPASAGVAKAPDPPPMTTPPTTRAPEKTEKPKETEPADPHRIKLPIPGYDIPCDLSIWRPAFVIKKITYDRAKNKIHFLLVAKRRLGYEDDGFRSIKFYDEDNIDLIQAKNVVFDPDPTKGLREGESTRASLEIPAPAVLKKTQSAAAVFSGFFAK